MPFPSTGSPVGAVAAGIRARLVADATLMALVSGVYGHVSEHARVSYPFLVIGQRTGTGDAGAMQTSGSGVTVQIDCFNGRNPDAATNVLGPGPVHAVQSRVYTLLERHAIAVTGYALIEGSLHREFEDVTDEPDEDAGDQRVYHGVQRWSCEVHDV